MPPYSNNGNRYTPRRDYRQHHYRDSDSTSPLDDFRTAIRQGVHSLWRFWNSRGQHMVLAAALSAARRLRQNLTYNRLFSFPHLLVALWVVVLLWGERWVFHSKVESCRWSNWEHWPSGADPHHLVMVADPQLVDPHSYPGRPWPLSSFTVLVTDNYLRRSYNRLQSHLLPDSIFFLGDLFDGGREWKTTHGSFKDPEWGPHPKNEQPYLKKWNKKYGEDYWLREYARFGDIFFTPWITAGAASDVTQKRRKLVASLPGNHDLGFGSEIKIAVRNRFETYFGEGNRVDVVGNHTFVSVDTVSMSAASSDEAGQHDLREIYKPTEIFLNGLSLSKKRAVERELRFQRGETQEAMFNHQIEELERANFEDKPKIGRGVPELPTILLTHVPLYRPPGTPCGPLRERHPPTKPLKGQTDPVAPDHRNAISVTRGYQYQNVLSESDSAELVKKVGNVVYAFSGDDHDYCELTHDAKQANVPEITVKSISMVMGVTKPGFLMASLYNPLDANGKPLAGAGQPTIQTHLCLLPSQLSTYLRYATFAFICIVALTVRAFLVPFLKLPRFALDREPTNPFILPVFKAKLDDYDEYAMPSGFSASHSRHISDTRDRSGSLRSNGLIAQGRVPSPTKNSWAGNGGGSRKSHGGHHGKSSAGGKWGWSGNGGSMRGAPKILIPSESEELYNGGKWKAAASTKPNSTLGVALTELWTTVFRVAWMVVFIFGWLNWRG
ncbi:hypothetical protein B0T25DRAFT_585310 [Lasiosphaeria hispida]|uniref:Calcineurin-like phosphoesterase domain-containing protein n=1 Tax=Lasiosphaeria hispida TaxID=260671 RepID=A0AAJ0H5M2_9PEZI|nr:hypothetical protein B0T25DRAFT_585310 [Lasiosphaeria hispida]